MARALATAPGDAKCRAVLQNREPGAKGASGHEIVPHGDLAFFVIYQGRNPAISLAGSAALAVRCSSFMQIMVRDNNVDQALRALKKKLQREGVYREMKLRRHYEKPSEVRAREKAAAVRRARKMERKRAERDGVK